MSIKIKCCPTCWRSYTLETWRRLPLVSIDPLDSAETRRCERCARELVTDVLALGALDLRTPIEMMDDRLAPVFRRRRRRQLASAFAVALSIMVCVVAFVLWSR